MKILQTVLALFFFAGTGIGQATSGWVTTTSAGSSTFGANSNCDSWIASITGGWKDMSSAPRDGTEVEIMETYGVAPWYAVAAWTRDTWGKDCTQIANPKKLPKNLTECKETKFKWDKPTWVIQEGSQKGGGPIDEQCLLWRPYKHPATQTEYVDPTGGKQDGVEYWCDAIHRPYNKHEDKCE